jgi:hypothetical protein
MRESSPLPLWERAFVARGLAGDGLKCAAFILVTRVIVNDHRWQASSYKNTA